MTASKEQMEITIGPYENIQQGMFLVKSDLSVDRIAKVTAFDESYYKENLCDPRPIPVVGKNYNIRWSLNYNGLWSKKQNCFLRVIFSVLLE